MREYALAKVGLPYRLGEEFDHPAGPVLTSAEDGDCSGIWYAMCVEAGVLVNGKPATRETADTYYSWSTRLSAPSRIGDCCWFPKSGRKTHMAVYIGEGQVIEAGNHGPSGVYPGHGYVGLCSVAEMDARGCVWGRLDTDIEEDEMTEDEVRRIVHEEIDVIYSADVAKAQAHLEERGVIGRRHAASKAASVGYVDLISSRILKLLGK